MDIHCDNVKVMALRAQTLENLFAVGLYGGIHAKGQLDIYGGIIIIYYPHYVFYIKIVKSLKFTELQKTNKQYGHLIIVH